MTFPVIVRGGGDLASGVVMRLHHAGMRLAIAEIEKPLAVRRTVSFAEAIYADSVNVEDIAAKKVSSFEEAEIVSLQRLIPVIIEPTLEHLVAQSPMIIVDAIMTKQEPETNLNSAQLVIGLGPGFIAGKHCHAVIETLRGHNLGRVFWEGSAAVDSKQPGSIVNYKVDRVLRSPGSGYLEPRTEVGQRLKKGDLIATVTSKEIRASFDGVLRGLIHPSVELTPGMKIGDLDPRDDPSYCYRVSDKALAIGGGVLEAILSRKDIRSKLWV